ncbi:ATP-dependent RNA helicase SrmB [Candidatus Anstonella stagnisolia]|nr:ATP-dependent RNA helicase SrmB [Candidatus Anstonella stagnisolia]
MAPADISLKLPPRSYQLEIANSVLQNGNTLVVLPTGLGKTLIAFLLISQKSKEGRCFLLAPTRPLCEQHLKTLLAQTSATAEDVELISGKIQAAKRAELYKKRIIISTPQCIKNDLLAGRLSLDGASLCIFDEAHRAVGNYSYTLVAKAAAAKNALLAGLTASPGGNKKKIQEIVDALLIKNVQILDASDPKISQYVKALDVRYIPVELGKEMLAAKEIADQMAKEQAEKLKGMGFFSRFYSKKPLLELRARILADKGGRRFAALSHHSTLFNLVHILELLETQGVSTCKKYIEKIRTRTQTKASARLLQDYRFAKFEHLLEEAGEHPKLAALVELIKSSPEEKYLVFAQYRNQVEHISQELVAHKIRSRTFMGKKEGFTQEQQKLTIEAFRNGEFDVMVATSIGEEGLDIPLVDTVVFFEPIPSEIRSIQRRGRAGRAKAGKVFVLLTKGTRDEAFYWASKNREKKMKTLVQGMADYGVGSLKAKKEARAPASYEKQQAKTNEAARAQSPRQHETQAPEKQSEPALSKSPARAAIKKQTSLKEFNEFQ